jgi:hypothetical protein
MKSLRVVTLLMFALLMLSSHSASAETYDWTLSGTINGSGTLTTNDTAITNGGSVGETITGIGGTFDGFQITALSGGCDCDNILYPSNFGSDGFGSLKGALDALGLGFVANSVVDNIFFAGSGYDVEGGALFASGETFSVTPAPTPLPGALPLMAGGLGFFAFINRKRKQKSRLA